MIALIKRIALALTLTLGIALAAQASYPKHIKVTTDNGAVVTVVALSDNVLKVINQPAGTTRTAGGRASVLDENDRRALEPVIGHRHGEVIRPRSEYSDDIARFSVLK